jgi:hypothetical protein
LPQAEWDGELDEPRVWLKGLKTAAISNTDLSGKRTTQLCHTLEWKPDINFFKSNEIPNMTLSSPQELNRRRSEIEDLQLVAMLMITDALDELRDIPIEWYEGHFRKYHDWLLRQLAILKSDSMIHVPLAKWAEHKDDQEFKERLYREVASRGPEGEVCVRSGTYIAQVLRKEVDPFHLMFGMDDLMDDVYFSVD